MKLSPVASSGAIKEVQKREIELLPEENLHLFYTESIHGPTGPGLLGPATSPRPLTFLDIASAWSQSQSSPAACFHRGQPRASEKAQANYVKATALPNLFLEHDF